MSSPAVALRDVELGYRDRVVFSGIDVSVESEEIVTVIGGSGSGKSTLLRAITGLLPPRRGHVEIFGEDLYALPPSERGDLLSRTGVLFQHDALFGSMTVLRNVMFPAEKLVELPQEVTAEIARLKLEFLGVAGLADRNPDEISGGQAKRVALARATVLDPELVLCDEPTAGLDPLNAASLRQLLLSLRRNGATLVVVTHDMQTVRAISDRTLLVGGGGVEAAGPPQELEHSENADVRAFFEPDHDAAQRERSL